MHDPHYNFTLDKPESSTLRINAQGWDHMYRAKNSVLISVGVSGIERADRIAATVLQTITDRIK